MPFVFKVPKEGICSPEGRRMDEVSAVEGTLDDDRESMLLALQDRLAEG